MYRQSKPHSNYSLSGHRGYSPNRSRTQAYINSLPGQSRSPRRSYGSRTRSPVRISKRTQDYINSLPGQGRSPARRSYSSRTRSPRKSHISKTRSPTRSFKSKTRSPFRSTRTRRGTRSPTRTSRF